MSIWDTSEFFIGDFVEESPAWFNGRKYDCIRYSQDEKTTTTNAGRSSEIVFTLMFHLSDFSVPPKSRDKITFEGKEYMVDGVSTDSANQDIYVDLIDWK